MEPGSYVVLFGGGNPSGFTVPVYTDDGRIGNGLTGKGEEIRLIDDNGHEIAIVSHTPWPTKQSLVRHPPDGDELVPHKTASTVKALFSPGHTHIIPKPSYPLFISEVLADPPCGLPLATPIETAGATRMKTNSSNSTTPGPCPSP